MKVIQYYKNGLRCGLLIKEGYKYDHILESDFKIRKHEKGQWKEIEYSLNKYIKKTKISPYSLWKYKKDTVSHTVKKIMKVSILSIFIGCASNLPKEEPRALIQEVNPPEWVSKGHGAFTETDVFYGIGSATKIEDWSFQRVSADNRARNDLAKVIDVYIASLYKDYRGATKKGGQQSLSDNLTEEGIQILTSISLHGIKIVDHWEHPQRNELFSLARLDLKEVQKSLNNYLELSDKVQDEIRKKAEKLHKELDKRVRQRRSKLDRVAFNQHPSHLYPAHIGIAYTYDKYKPYSEQTPICVHPEDALPIVQQWMKDNHVKDWRRLDEEWFFDKVVKVVTEYSPCEAGEKTFY